MAPKTKRLKTSDYVPIKEQTSPFKIGGRLNTFVQNWLEITDDAFVLSVVRNGYQISVLESFPGVLREVTKSPPKVEVLNAILLEIDTLVLKGAVVQVTDSPELCLSPIFCVPKRSGDLRVILNLKKINRFLPDQKFRMETLSSILPQLSSLDWAVSIDLKDAYFHVPIHRSSRRLLGFQFLNRVFQYVALPFGLKDSPWVFTRVVATVVEFLRKQGVRMFYYLDDWLIVAESKSLLLFHLSLVLRRIQDLGFLVNWKKSSLEPQRVPIYLGAVLDIPRGLARPAEHRVVALQKLVQELSSKRLVTARRWQVFLGHLASMVDLVPHCKLLMRRLQIYFLRFFSPVRDDQEKLIPLSEEIKVLVLEWASPSRLLEGKRFVQRPPDITVTTDASTVGWGAVCLTHRLPVGGQFRNQETTSTYWS